MSSFLPDWIWRMDANKRRYRQSKEKGRDCRTMCDGLHYCVKFLQNWVLQNHDLSLIHIFAGGLG